MDVSPTRRPLLLATAVVALGLGGCGDIDLARTADCPDDGGPCFAGGGDGDGGPADPARDGAAPGADAGMEPPSASEAIPATSELEAGLAGVGETDDDVSRGTESCYDGLDNDGTDEVDCEDRGCVVLGSCCVGHGDCCSDLGASAPLPRTLDFDGVCTGDPLTSCLADDPVVAFGDPGPWVRGSMLHPGGDASYDSGLVIGDPVDLGAMRVEVQTSFGRAAECSGTCLEGAGVAFTEQQDFDETTHIRPLVGLLSSGSRSDVSLVVSGEIVDSWELTDATEPWTLVLRPTGLVEVFRGTGSETEPEGTSFFPVSSATRLVAYGRNRNPMADAPDGSRIGALSIRTELCDMPTAWSSRERLFVAQPPVTGALDTGTMRGASIALGGDRLSMVFENAGVFMFAQRVTGDDTRFALAHPAGSDVLQPGRPWDEGGIHDPELFWADDHWVLFYTAVDGTDGTLSIGRATTTTPASGFEPEETPFISPDGTEVVGYSMPTVARLGYDATTWIMIVRADLAGGGHQLRPFVSRDGGESFEAYRGTLAGLTTRDTGLSIEGFDADEIAEPSLVIHNGAYHLYYAGRRGTRWRIGMLASDELLNWREIGDGGPVLSSDGNGRDRVGVRHPDVWAQPGSVELFYTGNDGARDTLFRALRRSTAGGSR